MAVTIDLNKVIRVFAFLTSLLCIVTGCIGIWRTSFSGYTIGGGDPSVTTTNRNAWWSVFIVAVLLGVLGISSALAEAGLALVRTRHPVLHYSTRAIYYAIMGLLAFGVAGDLGFATMIVCAVLVIVLVLIIIIMHPTSAD